MFYDYDFENDDFGSYDYDDTSGYAGPLDNTVNQICPIFQSISGCNLILLTGGIIMVVLGVT
jgi:hypothetical protein